MNLLVHHNASLPANNEDPHVQSATSLYVHGCPFSHKPPVHFDAFIPVNHKDLLFDLIVHLHDHRCTCSSTDLFILILSFRLTGTVCRSASLLLYIHTQVYPSFSIYLFSLIFPSGKTRTVSCQLIYWSTYPQTFQKINRPVYFDGFLPANHKDLHARIKDINYKNVQVEH